MAKNDESYTEIYPESHAGINININLPELPKCPHCNKGIMFPLQYTDHRSVHVFNYGWICNYCHTGWMWEKGKLITTKLDKSDENDDDPM